MAIRGNYDLIRPVTEYSRSGGWLYDKKGGKYQGNLQTFYNKIWGKQTITSDAQCRHFIELFSHTEWEMYKEYLQENQRKLNTTKTKRVISTAKPETQTHETGEVIYSDEESLTRYEH